MSKALIAGINQVAADKGLDREVIFEAIEAALISAYKRNYGSIANVTSEVDRVTGEMRVFAEREVVEEAINERTEITLEDANKLHPTAKLGDVVNVQTDPEDFGRIAAQTAKQVILQRIREAERDTVYENFAHRVGEIINAQVRSNDNLSGAVSVMLNEKHESLLMREEQIPGERLRRGDYIRVYIVDVHKSTRGPVIKLSRTHRNLLRRLMEQEIPEVRDGVVEIKGISREPGARSKAAVMATVPGVDPVGSCVGMRGMRIQNIVNELAGEKIDVVEWSTDLPTYISNALSPAKVNNVLLDDSGSIKTAIVVVPDRQLSLAIGKEGQNARLAAKLTGWRIDIKSESEAMEEGLDKLIEAQVHSTKSEDLLAVAERILQDTNQGGAADDMFSRAAQAVQESSEQPDVAENYGTSLDQIELPPLEEEAPAIFELPDVEPVTLDDLVPLDERGEVGELLDTSAEDDRGEEETDSMLDLTAAEGLPAVITADMLRARRAQRQASSILDDADFEIPPELLVGLDEDEDVAVVEELWEDEEVRPKSKGKPKPKPRERKPPPPDSKNRSRRKSPGFDG